MSNDANEVLKQIEDQFNFKIPEHLKQLSSYQYWLLSHQITALRHAFNLGMNNIIEKKDIQDFKYTNDRTYKYVLVNRDLSQNSFNDLLNNLTRYKEKWNFESDPFDTYLNFDEFILKDLSVHFVNQNRTLDHERILIFKMICLLQDNNKTCEVKI